MEKSVKVEIIKMFIPLIGVYWVLNRILPGNGDISWWDTSNKALLLAIGMVFYQILCWVGWKYLLEILTDLGIIPIFIHL